MSTSSWSKYLAAGLLTASLMGLAATAFGAQDTAGSSIDVLDAISVTQAADMNFGRVTKPTSAGSLVLVLDAATGTVTKDDVNSTGDGAIVDATSSSEAAFTVTGTAEQAITLDLAMTDFSDGAVTMSAPMIYPGSGSPVDASSTVETTLTGGNITVGVGATVTVTDLAPSQVHDDGSFTLTANYK